jgi:hypothetical protein
MSEIQMIDIVNRESTEFDMNKIDYAKFIDSGEIVNTVEEINDVMYKLFRCSEVKIVFHHNDYKVFVFTDIWQVFVISFVNEDYYFEMVDYLSDNKYVVFIREGDIDE